MCYSESPIHSVTLIIMVTTIIWHYLTCSIGLAIISINRIECQAGLARYCSASSCEEDCWCKSCIYVMILSQHINCVIALLKIDENLKIKLFRLMTRRSENIHKVLADIITDTAFKAIDSLLAQVCCVLVWSIVMIV